MGRVQPFSVRNLGLLEQFDALGGADESAKLHTSPAMCAGVDGKAESQAHQFDPRAILATGAAAGWPQKFSNRRHTFPPGMRTTVGRVCQRGPGFCSELGMAPSAPPLPNGRQAPARSRKRRTQPRGVLHTTAPVPDPTGLVVARRLGLEVYRAPSCDPRYWAAAGQANSR
jgi:hypothetical protein